MIQLLLLLLLGLIAFWLLPAWKKSLGAMLAKSVKTIGIIAISLLLLYLMATGRLNFVFALGGIALAFIARLITVLLHYAPQLHRFWVTFTAAKRGSEQPNNAPHLTGNMTSDEAYQVLGLKSGASKQDIIAAHRKLMQINHPDRGGSNYLASKINLAKKILLQK